MILSMLFAFVMGIIIICSGIYMLGLIIYCAFKPKPDLPDGDGTKKYIVVEAEETEEERQCREYGDCCGYSYYW